MQGEVKRLQIALRDSQDQATQADQEGRCMEAALRALQIEV